MNNETKKYVIHQPIVDTIEVKSSVRLMQRYNNIVAPNKVLSDAGKQIIELVPQELRKSATRFFKSLNETELYKKTLSVISDSFKQIEQYASRNTLSEAYIISNVNRLVPQNDVTRFDEICLARGYNISALVFEFKKKNLFYAVANGAGTGPFGFVGLPANLALTVFLFYRAVQSVAMLYGYNVKEDGVELLIAAEVLVAALNPLVDDAGGVNNSLKEFLKTKPLFVSDKGDVSSDIKRKLDSIKAAAKSDFEEAGGKSAYDGLEYTVYKKIFEKIGEKLSKKIVKKGIPFASALLGAVSDGFEMNSVIEYADIFYNKRFLAEKEENIKALLSQ